MTSHTNQVCHDTEKKDVEDLAEQVNSNNTKHIQVLENAQKPNKTRQPFLALLSRVLADIHEVIVLSSGRI
jgi:hypothetical protein